MGITTDIASLCNILGRMVKHRFKRNFSASAEVSVFRHIAYQGSHRTMQVVSSGEESKPPVLFLHGSPGSWHAWSHLLRDKTLLQRFHLLAVDRPGYGGSTPGITEPSLQRQAEDVLAALHLNTSGQKPIVVGHSYGGALLAQIGIDQGASLAGLIFIAASVDPALEKKKVIQTIAALPLIRDLIPRSIRVCNEEILALQQELELLLPEWHKVIVHTVVLQGDKDDLVPLENAHFLQRMLPEHCPKEILIFEGKNHFLPWTSPHLIVQAIEKIADAG